jgi:hypothetical protein
LIFKDYFIIYFWENYTYLPKVWGDFQFDLQSFNFCNTPSITSKYLQFDHSDFFFFFSQNAPIQVKKKKKKVAGHPNWEKKPPQITHPLIFVFYFFFNLEYEHFGEEKKYVRMVKLKFGGGGGGGVHFKH